QPRAGRAASGLAARAGAGVAQGEFGADLGIGAGAIARIDAAEVGAGVAILVVDEGCADAQLFVARPIADAAARVEHALADAVDLIFRDDILGIEVRRAAENGGAEPQRSSQIIDIVIDVAGHGNTVNNALA